MEKGAFYMEIRLPISKSIANRLLICKAMRGDDLSEVVASPAFASYPDDVRLLAQHLKLLQAMKNEGALLENPPLDCGNAGTVARFLTAYCAQIEELEICLTGSARLKERPIGQLVEALRALGADIAYAESEGRFPLRIRGRKLLSRPVELVQPASSQFVSALLLVGADVQTDSRSPYIELTRSVIRDFREGRLANLSQVEPDWSSVAFWLERQALGLIGELSFEDIHDDSPQGDRVAVELFGKIRNRTLAQWDFSSCPDLYPAAAVCCHLLGLHPVFTGLESLPHKESDRLKAVAHNLGLIDEATAAGRPVGPLPSFSDHRIAMAFLAAGFPVCDASCISKSYPAFLSELLRCERLVALREGAPVPTMQDGLITHIQPDGGKGKKHALLEGMRTLSSEYVWLADADVRLPETLPAAIPDADMIILPLRMKAQRNTLIERLQVLEYDAIQALTMHYARNGRAVMCAGANLIVRRSAWLECAGDIHPEIPSGDDMFMLEAMKRRGKKVIAGDPSFAAEVAALTSLGALLRQRMRWAGKSVAYSDQDILLCGLTAVLSNLLVVVCPPWFLIKWIADMKMVIAYRTWIREGACCNPVVAPSSPLTDWKEWGIGALLTLLYPWYMLICLVGGFFRRRKW